MLESILFAAAFALSYGGTGYFRRWTLRREILDIPNERSSHSAPTPRGGGLVIAMVAVFLYLATAYFTAERIAVGYLIGAVLIAAISWLDDLFSISSVWRLAVHSICGLLIVWDIGYFETLYVPYFRTIELGYWGAVLTICWIVWLTNAYNFMDGIDGIAGVQAVTAGIGWLVIGLILGSVETSLFAGIIAFSSLGFLIHNWQPAKIFMGDVGSAFLGFSFAVLPLITARDRAEYAFILPLIGVFLVWFFVFDAVFTLIKRLIGGKKIWLPHREHIYQRLVIEGFSHQFVTLLYGVNSLIVLAAVIFWLVFGNYFLFIVIVPIIFQTGGLIVFGFQKYKSKPQKS